LSLSINSFKPFSNFMYLFKLRFCPTLSLYEKELTL